MSAGTVEVSSPADALGRRAPLVRMQGVVKVYPPSTLALDEVSVEFDAGEIHALVGENGAGKSTLMKVLCGMTPYDRGQITYRGRAVRFHSAGEAIAAGIGMVHQEILLVNEYSVWENVVLGAEPTRWLGAVDKRRARSEVEQLIRQFNFAVDPDAVAGEISVAARQKTEILKLLYRNVSVLILDEPTAVLTPQEVPQLFDELRALRDQGRTIIFISHRLEEVLALADRVTVLRQGRHVATLPAARTSRAELAALMVGRPVLFTSRRQPQPVGEVVLSVKGLRCEDEHGRLRLGDVDLEVRRGEIVGIAGVEGNGQLELVNAIVGLLKPSAGRITVAGVDLTSAPVLVRRRYIAYVPQDRGRMGGSLTSSLVENAIMGHHRLNPRVAFWHNVILNPRAAERFTRELAQTFDVRMPRPTAPLQALSGGNQQKLILGRELLLDRPLVVLDQPTRGLDVGSIEYVHDQVLAMRRAGRAVLLISANLEELFLLADRIVVLYRGRVAANLPTERTSFEEVGRYMLGLDGLRALGVPSCMHTDAL